MQITCKVCGTLKLSTEYYARAFNRDRIGTCRECWKARVRERRRTNPAVQSYDRDRAKLPHRRNKAKADVDRWRLEHPELYRAQNAINNAIRDGKLARSACSCGATKNVFGITTDPNNPLQRVRWICARCYHRGRFSAKPAGQQVLS